MNIKLYTVLIASTLSGCAGTLTYTQPPSEKFSFPPTGEITTISVGEDMLKQGLVKTLEAMDIKQEVSVSLATALPKTYINSGYAGNNRERSVYFTEDGSSAFSGVYEGLDYILVDRSKDIICLYERLSGAFLEATDCSKLEPISDNIDFYTKPVFDKSSFQQTLIYTGKVGNRIRFAYREFNGNSARTAFSKDVEYDLNESSIISYKGASIEVIKANNNSISYKVITNFRNYK